jgi:hypothetical protein
MIGNGLKSLKADYSKKNFFNENKEMPDMEFGQFYQAAGVKFGKGRVLAFTDSTVFSNFWLHIPGKPELLLASINWLNRENLLLPNIKPILLLAGFLFVNISVWFSFKKSIGYTNFLNCIFIFLSSLLLAIKIFSIINHQYYALPQPKKEFVKICFDLKHSSLFLPINKLIGPQQDNFHTFYVWTQRLGYVPNATANIEKALNDSSMFILINPDKKFSIKSKRLILNFVEAGGKVLLMDNALNINSTANEICQIFGIKLQFDKTCVPNFYDFKGRKIFTSGEIWKVNGGKPLLTNVSNCPIISVKKKGKGFFAIMSNSILFSNIYMGSTGMLPTSDQMKTYELEFWMLKRLVEM